jgi:hypothetical protein
MYPSAQDTQSSDNKFTYKLINKDINLCVAQAQTFSIHSKKFVDKTEIWGFRWHRRENQQRVYIKVSVFTVDMKISFYDAIMSVILEDFCIRFCVHVSKNTAIAVWHVMENTGKCFSK